MLGVTVKVVVKVIIEVVGIGGWLENWRVMLISTKIEVEVDYWLRSSDRTTGS